MKFKRRLLSLLLVFVMLLSFVPTAFADEVTGGTGETDPEITTPAEDEATSDGGEDAVPDAVADPTGGAGDADDADGAGDAGSETAGPAENEDNANQIVGEVEPWVYQPSNEPAMALMLARAEEEAADASRAQIRVTNGYPETDPKFAAVPDATVEIKVGTDVKGTFKTDAEGYAVDEDGTRGIDLSKYLSTTAERQKAEISAKKVVEREVISDSDNGREPLLSKLPGGIRWEKELHSEWIDLDGNWRGEEIPVVGGTLVDITFVLDITGSMGDDIKNVCDNITTFAGVLDIRDLDYRFSFICYRDIKISEPTYLYTDSTGKSWFKGLDEVKAVLSEISSSVNGGGDTPETAIDGLGYAVKKLDWRTGSNKFAFLITDANFWADNNYGYTTSSADAALKEVARDLVLNSITTSVITSPSYEDDYEYLYKITNGQYKNIDTDFAEFMSDLAQSVSAGATGDMTLELTEPRLLVNMTASYLDNGKANYELKIRNMLKEYSKRIAETTDGHVIINAVELISTDSRMDFYTTNKYASMADIRIESTVNEEHVRVHSNAHVGGFFDKTSLYEQTGTGSYTDTWTEDPATGEWVLPAILPAGMENHRFSYERIQLSGIEGAGWENSLAKRDEVYGYSTTVAHETGHYLFGFFDEYLDGAGNGWTMADRYEYGLMDNQHYDIEMSKDSDYTAAAATDAQNTWTEQKDENKNSCENHMSTLLTTNVAPGTSGTWTKLVPTITDGITYNVTYTTAAESRKDVAIKGEDDGDRKTTNYPEAEKIQISNLIDPARSALAGVESATPIDGSGRVNWSYNGTHATIDAGTTPTAVTYTLAGGSEQTIVPTGSSAEIPVANGLTEVRVYSGNNYNAYYIDSYSRAHLYTSISGGVVAYVNGAATYIADSYTNFNNEPSLPGFTAMNEATHITTTGTGKIYAEVDGDAYIDYTALAWYKSTDGGATWTQAKNSSSRIDNEGINYGVTAEIDGSGLYVLMSKQAEADNTVPAPEIVNPEMRNRDGFADITIAYDQPDVEYYNVYYSSTGSTTPTDPNVFVARIYGQKGTLNLIEPGREVMARVEAVFTSGSRSPLSAEVKVTGGTAYTIDSKFPDYIYNKNRSWNKYGIPIDGIDSDGDGIPDAVTTPTPAATTTTSFVNIPAFVGGTVIASNRNAAAGDWVNLFVTPAEGYELTSLTVTDQRGWPVTLREISGGYYFIMPAARVNISAVFSPIGGEDAGASTTVPTVPDVSNPSSIGAWVPNQTEKFPVQRTGTMSFSDVNPADWYYESVQYSWQRALMNGTDAGEFSPNASMTRGMVWTVLARMNGRDTDGGSPWYQKGLDYVVYNDISDGTDPNGSITRQQLITMLWRNEGDPYGNNTSLAGFADGDTVADWADGAVRWAVSVGLLQGDETGALNPAATATRAEVATILMRYCQNVA